jgi:hypothetical protein
VLTDVGGGMHNNAPEMVYAQSFANHGLHWERNTRRDFDKALDEKS